MRIRRLLLLLFLLLLLPLLLQEPLGGSMVERGLYERVVLGSKPGQVLIFFNFYCISLLAELKADVNQANNVWLLLLNSQ